MYNGSTWQAASTVGGTVTSLSVTGATTLGQNLAFTGTSNRITGDFSNATVANRVAFQTSTTNGSTIVGAIPNGTGVTSVFRAFNAADPTNAGQATFGLNATDVFINSGITGTGTYLPLTFSTGGSERMRVDTSGNMLLGTSTTRTNYSSGSITPALQIEKAGDVRASITRDSDDASGPVFYLGKTRGTSVNSNTVVASGDNLGLLAFEGTDGTKLIRAASIAGQVDGTPGTDDMPGRLVFSTTADGGTSATERMRITSGGQVLVGATSGDAYNPLQLQSMLGFATTGGYYSEINNNLYYGSAAWRNKNQGPASQIVLDGGSSMASAIRFNISSNATSTAANTAISLSEAMRITAAGDVGIGTSSPASRFHVNNGEITIQGSDYGRVAFIRGSTKVWTIGPRASDDFYVFKEGGSGNVIFDGSNVGIGTNSPGQKLDVKGVVRSSIGTGTGAGGAGYAFYQFGTSATATENWHIGTEGDGSFRFYNQGFGAGIERARITSSGSLLLNFTGSPGTAKAYFLSDSGGGQDCLYVESRSTAGTGGSAFVSKVSATSAYLCYWLYGSSNVGSISSNGTSTTYNTTSDYRLKEQVQPITGALARNALLNPVKYKWKTNGSDGEGFIAHELQEQFPDAVTGTKDAVNADGNPVYQGVGTGPLDGHFAACVNELTALIEQQQAIITALTARVAALESN